MTGPIPGPYFIDENRAAICSRCERTGEVLTLAMFTEWGERDRATARAMVASLEMLAALKGALRALEVASIAGNSLYAADVTQAARAAIANAEGRDSRSLTAMRTGAERYRRALAGLAKS